MIQTQISEVSESSKLAEGSHNFSDTHTHYSVHREEQLQLSSLNGISIMDQTLWWSDIEKQIKGIWEDQVRIH